MSDPYDRVIPSATRSIKPTDSSSTPKAKPKKKPGLIATAAANARAAYKRAMEPLPYKRGNQSINAAEQSQLRKVE